MESTVLFYSRMPSHFIFFTFTYFLLGVMQLLEENFNRHNIYFTLLFIYGISLVYFKCSLKKIQYK